MRNRRPCLHVAPRARRIARLALAALALIGPLCPTAASSSNAAHQSNDSAPGAPTIESLEASIREIEAAADLPEAPRVAAVAAYRQAIDHLRAAAEFRAAAARDEAARAAAPSELEALRAAAQQSTDTVVAPPPDATLEQLRQFRDQAAAQLQVASDRVNQLEAERLARQARRSEIPTRTAQLEGAIGDARQQLAAMLAQRGPAGSEQPWVASVDERIWDASLAGRIGLWSSLEAMTAETEALRSELARYEATVELHTARREQAARDAASREAASKAWNDIVSRYERDQAAVEAAQARQAAAQVAAQQTPIINALTTRTVELAEMLAGTPDGQPGLLARRADAQRRLAELASEFNALQDSYARQRHRVRAEALADIMDARLRTLRRSLPDMGEHRAEMTRRRVELAAVQDLLADIEVEIAQRPDASAHRRRLLEALDPSMRPDMREEVTAIIDRALAQSRSQQDQVAREAQEYSDVLLALQETQQRLIDLGEEFTAFIDERILWIRSMDVLNSSDLRAAGASLAAMSSPSQWRGVVGALWADARSNPVAMAAVTMLFVLSAIMLGRARRMMRIIAGLIPQVYTDRFRLTLQALALTMFRAAYWPGAVWTVAWRLDVMEDGGDFAQTVAAGLRRAGLLLFVLDVHRRLCRPYGVGMVHFKWREAGCALVRRHLLWLMIVVTPLAFIVTATETAAQTSGNDALGRLAFITAMAAVTLFAGIVLRPTGGSLEGVLARAPRSWMFRLRHVFYLAVCAIPVGLGIAAGIGFYATALQLERRLVVTLWLLLALMVVYGMVVRWLFVARRRLAVEESRKRRAATEASGGTATTTGGAEAAPIVDTGLDLYTINAQTRQLLRVTIMSSVVVGIILIWGSLLPALKLLNRVEIWPNFGALAPDARELAARPAIGRTTGAPATAAANDPAAPAAEPTSPANGVGSSAGSPLPGTWPLGRSELNTAESTTRAEPEREYVSLANVLAALIAVIATIAISRNIPGVLEITLLQRLPLEASARYAITSLARYAITIIGIAIAFGVIGIGWSKVQWLAAAITLGVGFGLQEIFANFVSGVILLFEQPIRVGDTVTINGMEGTVTKIRMRATTVQDYDRREIVIPNKTLITEQIINHTLTDTLSRVVFTVGVAHDADLAKVEALLARIATGHPGVLTDPAPQIVCAQLTDSSVQFSLRVFIPSLDNALKVRHEITLAINRELRAAGIDIAAPLRDVRVTMMKPE